MAGCAERGEQRPDHGAASRPGMQNDREHQREAPSMKRSRGPPSCLRSGATARPRATRVGARRGAAISRTRRPAVRHAVADAVDGEEVPRRARVGLDLAADVLDVGVDRPLVRLEGHAVDRVEQLRAREDAPGLARQRRQQLELGGGQLDSRGRRRSAACAAVSSSRSPARTSSASACAAVGSPQHGAHAGDELAAG